MLFGTLPLNVLFYSISRQNLFYFFHSVQKKRELYSSYLGKNTGEGYDAPTATHYIGQSRLPELTEKFHI